MNIIIMHAHTCAAAMLWSNNFSQANGTHKYIIQPFPQIRSNYAYQTKLN